MRKNQRLAIGIAAVIAVAGITSLVVRHRNEATTAQQNRAQTVSPQIPDAAIVKAVHDAGLPVDGLSATNVGGIVVLKGTADPAVAQQAAGVVRKLGFSRVANLIVPHVATDDESMRRLAERLSERPDAATQIIPRPIRSPSPLPSVKATAEPDPAIRHDEKEVR